MVSLIPDNSNPTQPNPNPTQPDPNRDLNQTTPNPHPKLCMSIQVGSMTESISHMHDVKKTPNPEKCPPAGAIGGYG